MKEGSRSHVMKRIRSDPVALLIGVEHVAGAVGAQSTGRSHPCAHGNQLAIRPHHHAPAAPASLRNTEHGIGHNAIPLVALQPHADVQREPQVAPPVALRAVGVLVIVAGHTPAFGDSQIFVRNAVFVRIPQPGQFRALRSHERIAVFEQAQRFVQRRGEAFVSDILWRIVVDAIEEPDLTFANCHRQPVVVALASRERMRFH